MHSVAPPAQDPLTEPGPWNAVAVGYDEEVFDQATGLTEAAIELLSPDREDTVLDVATGPGTLAVRLAPRVHRVVAIDFAEAMIERLRGHVMKNHLHNLEVRLMDGQDLLFSTGSFDSAVSMFGLFLFDDRRRGLDELFRVVVPGGRVLISSWATPDLNTALGVGMEALRAALPDLPRPQGPMPTQDPTKCEAELDAAGFEQARTQSFKTSVKYGSVEEYWRSFERAAAPLVLLKQKLGEQAFAEAALRIQSELRVRCGDGPFSLDLAAIFTIGEVPRSAA
jgi:ubiquinone/menaquinone biosynthesis C-methylase UbiE